MVICVQVHVLCHARTLANLRGNYSMNIILKFKDADIKRKNKGKRKPQQLRQAKARTKQLVRKLTHTN